MKDLVKNFSFKRTKIVTPKIALLILSSMSLLHGSQAFAKGQQCTNLFSANRNSSQLTQSLETIGSIESSNLIPNSTLRLMVSDQSMIEDILAARLEKVIESNSPPKNWGDYIDDLPASVRRNFTRRLLDHNRESTEQLITIISEINPTEGAKDSVISFLGDYFEVRGFTPQEIKRMFNTNQRFNKFFDAQVPSETDVTLAHLVLAVKTHALTSPEHALESQWINPALSEAKYRQRRDEALENRNHLANRTQIKDIVGFAPIRVPKHLQDQIQAGFVGEALPSNTESQIRGVIVQGAYGRDGFILTEKLGVRRGMAQVERDVPGMVKALKQSLTNGILSEVDELDQRLFVDNWSLNSSPGLIKNIRQRALVVAKLDPSFTPLRIEIHAFPNADVLYRTQLYFEKYKRQSSPNLTAIKEFETLIGEIEELIHPSANSGSIDALIDEKLKAGQSIRSALHQVSANYDTLTSFEKSKILIQTRQAWKELRLANKSVDSKFFYFLGDRQFADMAMAEIAKIVVKLDSNPENQILQVMNSAWSILAHMGLDNMLSEAQIQAIQQEAYGIYQDNQITSDKKLELLSNLFSNSVDQVYYLLVRNFGRYDERVLRLVTRGSDRPPVRFVDSTLRSNTVFMMSRLVDSIEEASLKRKNIAHYLNGKPIRITGQVFNPGQAEGIIRVDANPLELTSEEIGVFSEMPVESGAVNGIITLGVGARLSHLQLLAKALQIPNVKFSPEALKFLKQLDGKLVRLTANKDGSIQIDEITKGSTQIVGHANKIEVPIPDYRIKKPISFNKALAFEKYMIAGPKGMVLMKLFNDPTLREFVPDGFILPFGFYRRYLERTGLAKTVDELAKVKIENKFLISFLTAKIRKHFEDHPMPQEMLAEVMNELSELQKRTGHTGGYFFRSDTNIEDLPGFNGAGLNESIANVKLDETQVSNAIRVVWASAFKEKSIMWRARALNATTVPVADPSEVILPTVYAVSSGVILSKGGEKFLSGKGMISANWGIGSVVEAGAPTEEIDLEGASPHRYSLTSSNVKPSANKAGGLKMIKVQPGLAVLNPQQVQNLINQANQIENVLGQEPKGWDIEWAVNPQGKVIILQARPVN